MFSVSTGQLLDEDEMTDSWDIGGCAITRISFSPGGHFLHMLFDWNYGPFRTKWSRPGFSIWRKYCKDIDSAEGWVKDSKGRLLLWIPDQYRDAACREGLVFRVAWVRTISRAPAMDHSVIFDIAGEQWAERFQALSDEQ